MTTASIRRGYHVIKTILHFGLDDLIPRHKKPWYFSILRNSLFWIRNKHKDKSPAERLKLAMQDLGPVYIKLGQMLSTRRDLLDDEWAYQLAMLQDRVPPFDSALARQAIEAELGAPITTYFDDFNDTPLASASISQVHTATLKSNGKAVVLKVLRPNVEQQILADLQLMTQTANILEAILGEGNRLRPAEVIEDYQTTILGELNLKLEALNAIKLRNNFIDSNSLYVPFVYEEHSYQRLMVMERIYGIPVSDTEALRAQGTNFKLLAERGVELFFTQVFRDNFFHADMHPGNIFISREHPDDPFYIGLDCGIMGTLTEVDKRYLAENFLAFFNRDYHRIAQLYIESGWVSEHTDIIAFEQAVKVVCEPMFNKPLDEISFGHVLLELFRTARHFDIVVQPQLVLLEKTLLYIEGLGRQLYPQLDLWQTAKPFLENWMSEQVGPKAMFKKVKSNAPFWADKLPEFPELIYDNLKLGRKLLGTQQQMLDKYLKYQQKSHKSNYLLITSAVLLICGTILFTQIATLWPAYTCISVGILIWAVGWRSRPKNRKF
ncbi:MULTISPECIES: ubiquinone biosynthesis regulatory protein kinase UbiB [Shewanella]|jgi:ubiquinone biosynthesis protein|uniref:ubiquinone biosynthesis regulatory protein kinase UbiB n=1 Tax=Shewanella TaxID=22 RepID=UPI000C5B122B|nr:MULTISPECIES: ubiquinone biosynthesis regulatory protein kinase UbiB [Shewanella]NCQ46921.1 ubiquinone biosynthesis regulatory protein kinase UbiB [Shewanella frigidimarina]MBB1475812.1 ubiquinone biosynthesis regulatory protein kinase UbiB [Shewanella sp. SG41-3]NCO73245.1 ubiquinone biosynthesis regulatory protein kinase UbiB [Shewanella vesiculosa]NCP38292.1 ubiquinone biosynthesis regulatory protein kinase UbiB [Shewanella vesiculosa]NCP71669.1 ubiquinone biosynthesis regulatory protein|tara:strand:- start:2752 stop:4401 length:1650 start_codon:yes stop_codon:yes gene_type:complete